MWVKNCIRHRLSLMGGDSYCNALLVIKGCYPQQRWSDCVCTGGKPRLRLLAEQTRQQRNEGDAHQSDTAALNRLIKEIVVHERIDEDKTRHISIEIHFNLKPIPEVEQVTA